jgi:periplasmic divalent cation tolerance protein
MLGLGEAMTPMFVYVTASSRNEALSIGRAVVSERLAACANVLDGMTSIYWWQESLQEDAEATLILKTRSDLIERLTIRIKDLHSYDCPCVVAIPIAGGNPAYLQWIDKETVAPADA